MNKDALKKALLLGIGSGILTWVFFSLIELAIEKKPMNESLFSTFGIIFLVAASLVETYSYYRKYAKDEKKEK